MPDYHYTECGLDNVFIEGAMEFGDGAGADPVTIPAIGQLHRVIAEGIVTHPAKMTGQELRLLRTEMGLTLARLAEILKVRLLTVSRWERNETSINDAAEMLVRLHSVTKLQLEVDLDVETVSGKVAASAWTQEIRIDGSNPGNYQLLDAA
ncbi:MAG: helix-turn-helix domain-containing protein [Albidovulum sp.]|nr:helix-turn-helix domain-containing protein [Albidovulum sp.]